MATKTEQLLAYLQTPGLSDAAIANEITALEFQHKRFLP